VKYCRRESKQRSAQLGERASRGVLSLERGHAEECSAWREGKQRSAQLGERACRGAWD